MAATYTLTGLDDHDLALVAAACSRWSAFLSDVAAGRYREDVATEAGYPPGRSNASNDAERLSYIAEALRRRGT